MLRIVRRFWVMFSPLQAVAARRALHEAPVLVDERHREAVDLRLADHGELVRGGEGGGALVPGPELLEVEGVRQR